MRTIFLSILIILGSEELSAQSGWFQQSTGTDITLRSVFMTDLNTGYCVGGDILIDAVDRGIILKTTNGGVNWFAQSPVNFDKILYSVTFPNSQTGYAVGRDASTYAIFKTTNGGNKWVEQEPPGTTNTPPLYSVYFFNAETGFASGTAGKIFHTTNGGTNWTVKGFPNISTLYYITFTSGSTGYMASDNVLLKTTDTGNTWDTTLISLGIQFQSVFFTDQNNGYAAGNNRIYRTTNSGNNWTSIEIQGNTFFSVYFPSPNIGYCSGLNTAIYKTTDSGNSWNLQTQPGGSPLYSIFFPNDTIGFSVGNVGFMLRTTTGGTVGIGTISTEIPTGYKLYQNYPNPFNPETVINYDITTRTHVNLSIYDISGKLIAKAFDGTQNAGAYRYNLNGKDLPGGVYFYRLAADEFTAVKKMILLK